MAETFNGRRRIRKKFGRIAEIAEMPNLIEVQKSSYDDFLMVKEPEGGRPHDFGLQAVFKGVFPVFRARELLRACHQNTRHAVRQKGARNRFTLVFRHTSFLGCGVIPLPCREGPGEGRSASSWAMSNI